MDLATIKRIASRDVKNENEIPVIAYIDVENECFHEIYQFDDNSECMLFNLFDTIEYYKNNVKNVNDKATILFEEFKDALNIVCREFEDLDCSLVDESPWDILEALQENDIKYEYFIIYSKYCYAKLIDLLDALKDKMLEVGPHKWILYWIKK